MTTYALAFIATGALLLGFARLPERIQSVISGFVLIILLSIAGLLIVPFLRGVNILEVLFNLSKL